MEFGSTQALYMSDSESDSVFITLNTMGKKSVQIQHFEDSDTLGWGSSSSFLLPYSVQLQHCVESDTFSVCRVILVFT